jgi:CheY-like chemotaxis protein
MRSVAVEGGTSALATLEASLPSKRPFAVALLDPHMPDVDGCALAEPIWRARRYAAMKLVMLSSAGQRQAVAGCRNAGRIHPGQSAASDTDV